MVENNREFVLDEMERTKWRRTLVTLGKDWRLYVLLVPMLIFLFLFRYLPMVGIIEAFKQSGTTGSVFSFGWNGLTNFDSLFKDNFFWRALRNTFVNSMYGLIFGFPFPIIVALLFSEIKNDMTRSALQIAVYLPRFISTVVITGVITLMSRPQTDTFQAGLITQMFYNLGMISSLDKGPLYEPRYFRAIFQVSGIWEDAGYGSIVYFAAIMAISPTNYEAAKIDGASKWQQIRHITFPGMAPTLTIMLILRIGQILNVGYEKVWLLYNNITKETADVISTYVRAMVDPSSGSNVNPGVAVAADMFNSVIAMCLVLGANAISRRVSTTSLF